MTSIATTEPGNFGARLSVTRHVPSGAASASTRSGANVQDRLNTARKGSALVWAVRAGRRAGLGCFGEPGVQSLPDLLRGVGTAAALCPGDHHSAGGDTSEACESQYLQPAHVTRLLPWPP
jgi:hypothetical protein